MTLEISSVCKGFYCRFELHPRLIQPYVTYDHFASANEYWKIALAEWRRKHIGEYAINYEFTAIFKNVWATVCKVEIAVNGYRNAVLFSFN